MAWGGSQRWVWDGSLWWWPRMDMRAMVAVMLRLRRAAMAASSSPRSQVSRSAVKKRSR